MDLLHIALQGCLRADRIQYGLTSDTGGHIRYLLELADALAEQDEVGTVEIATRAFTGPLFDPCYAAPRERRGKKVSILRVPTRTSAYLPKEDLGPELDAFAEGLIALLRLRKKLPRAVHAHFSDAAVVAERIERELGIPFVFTAHSLGAVKARVMDGPMPTHLGARIAVENRALERAAAVIVSSTDERDVQWAEYPAHDRAMRERRIRILPPGCETKEFQRVPSPTSRQRVAGAVERFLEHPRKPLVLGLARPVRKKNLHGLIEAYAAVPALRDCANLAIFAGSRDRLDDAEGENAEVWRALLEQIDRHDLWGHVALPKSHDPDDVPAIYDLAVQRRGVFVNLALNEPFGLTLLEAAASGLPVVATDCGGPVDIVARCRNGRLVAPEDAVAAGSAIHGLITDKAAWLSAASNGVRAVESFSWAAHAGAYLKLVEEIAPARRVPSPATIGLARQRPQALVVSDIDNTLTGDAAGLRAFAEWRAEHPEIAFAVATGRHLASARKVLADWGAPEPDLFVTAVGSEINCARAGGFEPDRDWQSFIAAGWHRRRIEELVRRFPALLPQPESNQGPYKLSYFASPDPGLVVQLRLALRMAGLAATVISSHGRYLDILPHRASKGSAAHRAARLLGVPPDRILAAGDSGNDRALLESVAMPILVANCVEGELSGFPPDVEARLWRSRHGAARGLLDGVEAAMSGAMTRGLG